MELTRFERLASTLAYAISLTGGSMILIYVVSAEFVTITVAAFLAASLLVVALNWRGSRYVLTHALNALLEYLMACVLSTLPLLIFTLRDHGYLLPRPGKSIFYKTIIDPAPLVLSAGALLLGMPILFLMIESIMDAYHGRFMENWPPLNWIRDRTMPYKRGKK